MKSPLRFLLLLVLSVVACSHQPEPATPSVDMAHESEALMADGSEVTGSYLVVWVRDNGEWKIAADIFN